MLGIRKRRRYLPYLVFDQQKVRYYGVFDETCPLSDTELRIKIETNPTTKDNEQRRSNQSVLLV